jgi:pimeloyl-ACP methyl ester carboxylesterase
MRTGSGLSKYTGQIQSVETIVEDVHALMSHLSVSASKTVIVGHSMGGMIACELASRYQFAGAALIGPIHPSPALADAFTLRIQKVEACKFHTS